MIRYNCTLQELEEAIELEKPTWLDRASIRTQKFIQNKIYNESSSIWSDVKPVYIALQQNKCVFCERKFETREYGTIEYDLEHFRPKSSVKIWPNASSEFDYEFSTGNASERGYYWLAYQILNYAASCKVCNSTLKSNYFPIAGRRGSVARTPDQLASEDPFLCYPISNFDEDPEKLVTFTATTARPVASRGHKRNRGQIIIDFFRLNARQILHEERAQMIMLLGTALRDLDAGEDVGLNGDIIQTITGNAVPHSACSRSFKLLWDTDKTLAKRIHSGCKRFIVGQIGTGEITD